MTVAEAVGRALAALGCRQVFGVVGSGNFVVTRALAEAGAGFVAARHETAAVTMADAYARVSGEVGVASVHQGPGFTNALTGLTEAAKSRTPLVLLAGDTSAAAVRSNFRIDQAAMAAAAGAVPERVHTAASALADVTRAFRRAALERRAVALMLPLDVQAAPDPPDGAAPAAPAPVTRTRPDAGAVAAAADLLARAERPAIVAGRGAVLAGAREALEDLAGLTGAVLATSALGNGLFAGQPYGLGIAGGFASPVAADLLRGADLVLAAGASLNMWTTRHGALVGPGATVVQIDCEVDAIGAHRPVDLGVVGDVGETARELAAALRARGHAATGYRTPEVAARIAAGRWRDQPYADGGTADTIDPRTLSIHLDRILPPERALAIDSGHFMGWPAMYIDVPDPQGFVFTQAFQSIGLGLAGAIGAAVARPDRVTVAALGDGGALMAAGEIETVGRLGLPLLVVVYNDAAYGAEVHHFGPQGEPLDIVRFPDTDIAALGRAAGAEGVTVRRVEDLAAVERWVADRSGPLVVDAKVTPTVVAEWLSEAFRAH
ncbi:MAG TPA: thiamine pyrophosphate-binding protein [Acidimicrobiales bacterium]|nr:thiamine pyrophosphate-binding protein [Acidimicrobiales bacterium]